MKFLNFVFSVYLQNIWLPRANFMRIKVVQPEILHNLNFFKLRQGLRIGVEISQKCGMQKKKIFVACIGKPYLKSEKWKHHLMAFVIKKFPWVFWKFSEPFRRKTYWDRAIWNHWWKKVTLKEKLDQSCGSSAKVYCIYVAKVYCIYVAKL